MPRRTDSDTQVDDERKYDDAISRRDKDDQKQQAHDAKKQSKLPHDSEIREARAHESELRDRFFHTDYSERTGLTPADRLAKMSHDATLISEERAKAAKLIEQDESAEFWEKEHAIQAAHNASPKVQKKTISATHDEIIPSSKISHSKSKPDEIGVQETSIDATEQVPKGHKQKQWEARFPEAAPESVKKQDDTSSAIQQESPLQQSAPEPKLQQSLWSFKKTNAGSLDTHDEDHPAEGRVSKIDRAKSKAKDVGTQEDAIDAKEQVPKGRKQKDVEPHDKLDDADDSSVWPPQESKAMRRAMKEAQAQMRKSGVSSGAGSQTAVDMQQRLQREKESLDKTLHYRQEKVIPNVEEWHADADNHPSVRDRETFREQVAHVADSIMHPFAHSKTDETILQRPLVAAPQPKGQKIAIESHTTSKPDEVGVQEEAIDAKEQVPQGRKQKKWEAQSPEAAPKSVKANIPVSNLPSTHEHPFRDRVGYVADRVFHPFSHHKTEEAGDRVQSTKLVNESHSMIKPDEVGVQETSIDATKVVPQGRKQKQWEARNPEDAPKSVKSNESTPLVSQQQAIINSSATTSPLKEHEIQVDASPSGVHLKGVEGDKSAGMGLIDRIEDKLESWKDEAGSKLSDLKHRITGDAEDVKDKSVELKDRAENKASDLKDRFDARKDDWSADLKRKESEWSSDLHSKEASLKSKARELKSDVTEDINAVGAKIGAMKDKAVNKAEEIGAEIKKEVGDFGSEIKKGTSSVMDKFSNKKGDEMDPIVEIQRERELAKSRSLTERHDFLESAGKWNKGAIDRDNKSHEPSAGLFSRLRGWFSPKSRSAQVEAEHSARIEAVQDGAKPDWPDARRTTQWERDNAINQSLLEPDRMQAKLDELRTTERSSAPAGGQDSKWNPKHTFAGDIRSSLSSKWSNLKHKTGEPAEEALPDDTRTWGTSAPSSPSSSFSKSVADTEAMFERHFTSVPHPSSFSPSLSDVTPSTGPSIISYRPSSPKPVRAYSGKPVVSVSEQPRYMQPVDFDAIAFDAAIEPW